MNPRESWSREMESAFIYRAIAAAEPERCVLIEAAGDTETVERAILAAIEARLGVRLGAG